jgi:hypothetical protein
LREKGELVLESRESGKFEDLETWIRSRCELGRIEVIKKVRKSSRKRRVKEVAVWKEVGRRCENGCNGLECKLSFVSVNRKRDKEDFGIAGIEDNTRNWRYKESVRKVSYKCGRFARLNREANLMIDEDLRRACKLWKYEKLVDYVYYRDFEWIEELVNEKLWFGEEKKECDHCGLKSDRGKDIINELKDGELEEAYVCDKCYKELKESERYKIREVGEEIKEEKENVKEVVILRKKIEIRKGSFVSEKGRIGVGDTIKEESKGSWYRAYKFQVMKYELHVFELKMGGI